MSLRKYKYRERDTWPRHMRIRKYLELETQNMNVR